MVSIIIPTYNRANSLKQTLHSIATQNLKPAAFEVIVVNNGGTDDTHEVYKSFIPLIKNVKYFFEETPGLLTGRHKGALEAKGDILSFIDDDVEISKTWLPAIEEIMDKDNTISFLTGPVLPKYEIDPPQWVESFWGDSPYGGKICSWLSLIDLGSEIKIINPIYVFGLNYTIRKSAFLELEGFHPDNIPTQYQQFQGDGENGLAIKADEKGMKAMYHPGVMLYHVIPASRLTFEYFDKRAFYQGVCNSFTEIRRHNGLPEAMHNQVVVPNEKAFKRVSNKIKHVIRKKILKEKIAEKSSKPFEELHNRFHQKINDGFNFHQEAFKSNSVVREWVLRKNYLDYKLPIS